ncbi:Eco57I restriction-modification methylase domain-containing protein [Mammaliicoccus lentus]|uniref:site-specific DNA-methyltransferase (adenine-specific) n=1 Tax=Mammaliicoccus lentus TaxID=42858 RepID=A0ABS6GX40_MAMLE|nr:N-6 DNA methylase [Mammaliicoccus lentus]MBU6113709.1 N-6 DNA methylase [Mammaliicoccus lentus]
MTDQIFRDDKEQARFLISDLVNSFEEHEKTYTAQDYKEASVRVRFIDKFFEILGWNVNEVTHIHPDDEEVIMERTIDYEKTTKYIDYTFNLERKIQFLVEAKKPAESLKKLDHIFQAKSYAFTEEIPFVILTNFKEFRLFDISTEPLHNQPNTDLVKEFDLTYKDYVDKFDLLWDTFSKQAVEEKSLAELFRMRRNLEENSEIIFDLNYGLIKGESLIDKTFLRDLRNWRTMIAQDIYNNNSNLSEIEISEIVQRNIDRLVFMRIIEDREIESTEHLRETIYAYRQGNIKSIKETLDNLYETINLKFNGLLFHQHDLSNESIISNDILDKIIEGLYYPKSPYNFKVIGPEILGRIFEQYLGEKIVIDKGIVRLELKDEQKKAGGIYYTPQKIVEKIVNYSIESTIENKSFDEIKNIRIADIACGSGSFLIGAYKNLIKFYEEYYQNLRNDDAEYINAVTRNIIFVDNNVCKLSMEFKKTILEKNIFGVDIDAQAIEVAKMSLYITMLEEGYREDTTHPILPDLDSTLKIGNSIISSDYIKYNNGKDAEIDSDHFKLINVFDWELMFAEVVEEGGFDCIIGNPPYIRIQKYEDLYTQRLVNYIRESYSSASIGNFDVSVVFIEKSLDLLKENGTLGYIVLNRFFITDYGEPLREIISSNNNIKKIVHFGDQQVFNGVTTYTCLLYLKKEKLETFEFTKVNNLNRWLSEEPEQLKIINANSLTKENWLFMDEIRSDLEKHYEDNATLLKAETERIFVGLQTDCDEVYILDEVDREGDIVYCKSTYTGKIHELEANHVKPFLKGSLDIKKYTLYGENKWLVFPYKISEGKADLISEDEYSERYPLTWAYLKECETRLKERNSGHGILVGDNPIYSESWYGHIYKKNLARFEQKKIVFPAISKGSWFAYDESGAFYFVGSGPGGGGGCAIILNEESNYNYYSLLGVLNSTPISFQINDKGTEQSGGYKGMNKKRADNLFIPKITNDDLESINKLLHISNYVRQIIPLYTSLKKQRRGSNEHRRILQQIEIIENAIDNIVYELYSFTPELIDYIKMDN